VSDAMKSVWFVRRSNGGGSYPVTDQGWRVVWTFTAGAVASVVVSIVLQKMGFSYWWLAAAVGSVAAAAWFLVVTNRHTDYSMTVSEFRKYQKLNSDAEFQNRG